MKLKFLIIAALSVSACTPVAVKKDDGIPPLSVVASTIRSGMTLAEVQKSLLGHKPFLQYTHNNNGIWDIVERFDNIKNNSMNANRLTILFSPEGKVDQTTSSFCFLPDIEPMLGNAPATSCYQKQLFPFDKKLTYDAIKRLLIISNYQVDHSDAASEIISATGMHGVVGNKDKMMFIKLSIIFSAQEKFTEVVMSATFSMSEKQSTWVQAGFAGVTLPVPLPFQRTEEWIDSGIVTPKFYLEFYDALSKLIAREYLPYTPVTTAVSNSVKSSDIPDPKTAISKPLEPFQPKSTSSNTTLPIDTDLMNLKGPIDGVSKKRLPIDSPSETNEAPALKEAVDVFSELAGKPIDSSKRKK